MDHLVSDAAFCGAYTRESRLGVIACDTPPARLVSGHADQSRIDTHLDPATLFRRPFMQLIMVSLIKQKNPNTSRALQKSSLSPVCMKDSPEGDVSIVSPGA